MPDLVTAKFAVPVSSDQFERLATDVASRAHGHRFQRNGRSGQAQHGVDAYAQLAGKLIGLQHKNMERIQPATIQEIVTKAQEFRPPLNALIVMTASDRDARIQRFVREVNAGQSELGLFQVTVMFWDDICEELSGHLDLALKYYPDTFSSRCTFGLERVRSWMHHVISPWLDSVDRAVDLLSVGDLTWRALTQRTETLRPLASSATCRRVREDFLRVHTQLGEVVGRCDAELFVSEWRAKSAHREIEGCAEFRKAVHDRLDRYSSGVAFDISATALPVGRTLARVAEYIVNNVAVLPVDHPEEMFWAWFGPELRVQAPSRELLLLRASMSVLCQQYSRLRKDLSAIAFEYCERYGMAHSS